jgi:hypothetical protein
MRVCNAPFAESKKRGGGALIPTLPCMQARSSKDMYSGETPKRFSKHRRQLRDFIVQWSVYKHSLLINTELNVFV